MDDYYFIGMTVFFVVLLTLIFIMIRNRIKGRDELHGIFRDLPKKESEGKDE
jgi:hypothetical protein